MDVYITSRYLKDYELGDLYITDSPKKAFARKHLSKENTVSYFIRLHSKNRDPMRIDNIFSKEVDLEASSYFKRVNLQIFEQYIRYLKDGHESFYADTRKGILNGAY